MFNDDLKLIADLWDIYMFLIGQRVLKSKKPLKSLQATLVCIHQNLFSGSSYI